MAVAKIDITDELYALIDKQLTELVGKEFDKHIEELQHRKNEIISGILLNIKKTIDIKTMGENVIFTIREISNN